MVEEGDDTYALHLVLHQELEMLCIMAAFDVQVPRDEGVDELIKLIDEGTLDIRRRLRKKFLGSLLADRDCGQLTTVVRLALVVRGVDCWVGTAKGG